MEIYVVQAGDTIRSIAEKYNKSVEQLIEENGIQNPAELVVGQCIVIAYPQVTYVVGEGDSLESISKAYNTSIIQLLRNNPYLSESEYIYPGETLIISYGDNRTRLMTNGYTNPFIDRKVLKRTLPFLTYLTIFGYELTADAEINEPDVDDIIQMSKDYGVAPIMLVSTLSYEGVGSAESAFNVIYNQEATDRYINNILAILKRKGLSGVGIILSYLYSENVDAYNEFVEKVTKRINYQGYIVVVSIPPVLQVKDGSITFEKIDYSVIGKTANQVIAMNYNWGYNPGPPSPPASVSLIEEFMNYLVTMIPPEKIMIGLPLIGYAWKLPFIIGVSQAVSLSYNAIITLAVENNVVIQFDERSQNPYFSYIQMEVNIPRKYEVWFVDARTMNAFIDQSIQFKTLGIAIWNIMIYLPQLWLIINSQYDIITLQQERPASQSITEDTGKLDICN